MDVPFFWITKMPTRMASVIGRTNGSIHPLSSGMVVRPSAADSTDMAGVSNASPKNRPAPQMAMMKSRRVRLPMVRWISAISDRVPPSPRLSSRVTMKTYLIVTTKMSAQTISEMMPITSSRGTMPSRATLMWWMDSRNA